VFGFVDFNGLPPLHYAVSLVVGRRYGLPREIENIEQSCFEQLLSLCSNETINSQDDQVFISAF
jgi:hypothetical protein